MGVTYLETKIKAVKHTAVPRYGVTVFGYSIQSGAPTTRMIQLENEKRWRRVMVLAFSNTGTLFVRIKGTAFVIHDTDLLLPNQ